MNKPPINKLAALLNIEPGEGNLVLLLLAQYALFGAASIFIQTAAFSLFLTQFDSQLLAYTYLINAAAVMGITFVYLRLGKRLNFGRLLVLNQAFQLVLTVAYRAGLGFSDARWVVFLLPSLFQIHLSTGNMAFWSLAARLFDVRQSKRLFGLVGAGQWMSIVVIGFILTPIVTLVGTDNLLLFAIVSLVGALGLMAFVTRRYAGRLALAEGMSARPLSNQRAREGAGGAGAGTTRAGARPRPYNTRYVQLIFALIVLWWLAFFFLDNFFYRQGAIQYPQVDQLAGFLGGFLLLLGVLALIGNFFVSGPLVSRLGLRTSLLILPVALLIGTALAAVFNTVSAAAVALVFWLTVVNKLLDMSVGLSFDKTAQTILYQPLPAVERARLQATGDGLVQPAAIGLSGLALIALNALFPSTSLPLIYALVAIVAGWTLVAVFLGRAYPGMLVQALTRRSLGGESAIPSDAASVAILKDGLSNAHPGAAIYSLNALEALDPAAAQDCLPEMLRHPDALVRSEVVRRIERAGLTHALPALRSAMTSEKVPEVRRALLSTSLALGDADAFQSALNWLEEPQLSARHGAMVGLLKHGGIEGVLAAGQTLLELAQSVHPANRMLAARVLGEAGIRQYDQPLRALLRDKTVTVRRAALRSAGMVKSPRLWQAVIEAAGERRTRTAAVAALVAGGEETLSDVGQALHGIADPDHLAILVYACGRIGGSTAIDLLISRLNEPDVTVRREVLRALNRCGYRTQDEQTGRFKAQLSEETTQAAWLTGALIDIGASVAIDAASERLLRVALTSELEQCRERVFLLLSFLYDAQVILHARDNLTHAAPDKQAYATEVLDVLLEQDVKRQVFVLLEPQTGLTLGQVLQRLSQAYPSTRLDRRQRLQELANSGGRLSSWTRACATYTLWFEANPSLATVNDERGANAYGHEGEDEMLTMIEKTIILKSVSIFAATPDEVLADVALVCEEVDAPANHLIFEKGDAGDSLYIVAAGRVRVHDGDRTIDTLASGDVFGEMAVLDPEPRSASVTAIEDSRLMRLDQAALDELMEDRPEVSRGIIRVLSHRLRDRMRELHAMPEPKSATIAVTAATAS